MYWAVLVLVFGCGRSTPPASMTPERPARLDSLAVGWFLKAAVSDARGQGQAAERAWGWVDRLDPGPWADVHRGEFLLREGRDIDAHRAFASALAKRPGMPEGTLGLGLALTSTEPEAAASLLEPLLPLHGCRIAANGPEALRDAAEAACLGP